MKRVQFNAYIFSSLVQEMESLFDRLYPYGYLHHEVIELTLNFGIGRIRALAAQHERDEKLAYALDQHYNREKATNA